MRASRWTLPLVLAAAFLLRAGQAPADGPARVLLSAGEARAVLVLDDNAASGALLARLPLDLTVEDFNGTEKIAMLPAKLTPGDAPDSCDPDVGSVTYYAPWGNLAIFYRDFRFSPGLVPLGRVESGMEVISSLPDGAAIRIEAMP